MNSLINKIQLFSYVIGTNFICILFLISLLMVSEKKHNKLIVNEYKVQLNLKTLPSQLCVQISSKYLFIC